MFGVFFSFYQYWSNCSRVRFTEATIYRFFRIWNNNNGTSPHTERVWRPLHETPPQKLIILVDDTFRGPNDADRGFLQDSILNEEPKQFDKKVKKRS